MISKHSQISISALAGSTKKIWSVHSERLKLYCQAKQKELTDKHQA